MQQDLNKTKILSSEQNSLFELIYAALLQNPLCHNIEKNVVEIIAKEAIKQKEFNNDEWLGKILEEHKDLGDKDFLKNYQSEVKSLEKINKKQEKEEIKSAFLELKPSEQCSISSQEELDSIIKEHSLWVESVLDPSKKITAGRANLRGLDLRSYELKGANLSCADLSHTNLSHLDLTNVNLSRAKLEGSLLLESDLRKTKLKNARLNGANLEGALLDPKVLKEVNLKEALNVPKLEAELLIPEEEGSKQEPENLKITRKKENNKAHPLLNELLI